MLSKSFLETTAAYLDASAKEREYLQRTADGHFDVVIVVAILNQDVSALEKIKQLYWEESFRWSGRPPEEWIDEWLEEQPRAPRRKKDRRKNPGVVSLSEVNGPHDPEDYLHPFDRVVDVDDFLSWFYDASEAEILKLRPTLGRLVNSWIAADYRKEQWSEWDRFEQFIRGRPMRFYQDWFDHHDGRLLHGYHLKEGAGPSYLARWMFSLVMESPNCRNIGPCRSCMRYCIRNRSGNFFCDVKCSRNQHSMRAKRKTRLRVRNKKLQVVQQAAEKVNRGPQLSEEEWKEAILEEACKLAPDIKAKFVTQAINDRKVPMPKFLQ